MSNQDKVCSLLVDEISLKSNLQYDRCNDVIVGFEDKGHSFGRTAAKATSALIFMFRGLASNWSQPIGYVFTASTCKAAVIKDLLLECLTECEKIGLNLKVIISDQGLNFQDLTKKLGVTIDKPYFTCNNNTYYYMYDIPHLLKSIRNNLYKYSIKFGNKVANCDVIKKFFESDQTKPF